MRQLLVSISLIFFTKALVAQIYGNKTYVDFSKDVKGLRSINVQFNANIILDYSDDEVMKITIDENIKDLVGIQFENGKLILDQVKWIEPSKLPTIRIGSPNLERVFQGTHSKTTLVNVEANKLLLEGNVGEIEGSGLVNDLNVNVSGTDLNLSEMKIVKAKLSMLDDSNIVLNEVEVLEANDLKDRRITLLNPPVEFIKTGNGTDRKEKVKFLPNPNLRYIEFDIKNNSWKRNHFVVVGPKRDGNTFSYGFSMLPFTKKSEKWSVGTQIFKESRSGDRELLVTIAETDEGGTVKLFE